MASHFFAARQNFSALKKPLLLLLIFLLHAQLSYSAGSSSSKESYYNEISSEDTYSDVDEKFSTLEECKRPCKVGEHKTCYHRFHVEFYTVDNRACDKNTTKGQCISADGFERTVTVINRQLPAPFIEVCKDDLLVIDVQNEAEGMEISIHWHGVLQKGFQYYDGVPYLTQCPIHSSSTFRYTFVVKNSGTHFYHAHLAMENTDGVFGALVVRDPCEADPHCKSYDVDDMIIIKSDWFHELSLERYPGRYRTDRGQRPKNILINGVGAWTDPDTKQATSTRLQTFEVEPGKRYRFRMINAFSSVCLSRMRIHGHNMSIIAQDGDNVKSVTVDAITSASGERVDFIVLTDKPVDSYWIEVNGLGECAEDGIRQLAILRYKGAKETPSAPVPKYSAEHDGREYNILNVTNCEEEKKLGRYCISSMEGLEEEGESYEEPDAEQLVSFGFYNFETPEDQFEPGKYKRYLATVDTTQLASLVANKSFLSPSSPLISQHKSVKTICGTNTAPTTCTRPCYCTNVLDIPKDIVLQILLYDLYPAPDLSHSFHMHGYAFEVVKQGFLAGTPTPEVAANALKEYNRGKRTQRNGRPSKKDTVIVPVGGYVIMNIKTSNPGWWLFHCHFTWHTATGMNVVLHVGTDDDLPPVPPGFPKCGNYTPDPRKKRGHHRPHRHHHHHSDTSGDNGSQKDDSRMK